MMRYTTYSKYYLHEIKYLSYNIYNRYLGRKTIEKINSL